MFTVNVRKWALLAVFAVSTSAAFADDLVPPPWVRGGPQTTTQEWDFLTVNDIFGHPINGIGNPYGQPQVTNPQDGVWLPNDSSFNPNPTTRPGIVCIAPGVTLKFRIPNQENLDNQKNVWAQVTWWAAPGTNVVVSPLAPAPNTGTIIGTLPLGSGWNHTTASFVLAQQPAFEDFWIQNFTTSNLYIDQVVIDTQCVPEPATMSILGFGGLAIAARRRRLKNSA